MMQTSVAKLFGKFLGPSEVSMGVELAFLICSRLAEFLGEFLRGSRSEDLCFSSCLEIVEAEPERMFLSRSFQRVFKIHADLYIGTLYIGTFMYVDW